MADSQSGAAPGYCVIILGKAPSATAGSPELYRHCSETPFDTRAWLQSPSAQATAGPIAVVAAQIHIFRAYSDANYGGNYWDYYAGANCDTAGYHWTPSDWWKTHLSSFYTERSHNCNYGRFTNRAGTSASTYETPTPHLYAYNDNTGYVNIFR